jgi:sulfoxide reductase heme-binding subunit YedZ
MTARRAAVIGAAIALAFALIADALLARAGLSPGLVPRAAGAWPWIVSRAAGVTALVALTLDVAWGLFLSTGAADGWIARARSVDIHRFLSAAGLALLALHALSLAADHVVRFDVIGAIIPFTAPYRPLAVGVGVIAAWLAVALHVSFALRKRLGVRAWRLLHHASFAAFALAIAHGVVAGSDGARPWMRGLYAACLGLVGALAVYRVALATSRAMAGGRSGPRA